MRKLLMVLAICITGYAHAQTSLSKVELYNAGVNAFKTKAYTESEKYFREYIRQYPTEVYGYYWVFRNREELDKTLKMDVAREDGLQFVRVAEKHKNTQQQIIAVYKYLAVSDEEIHQNFVKSLQWVNKILELDPTNEWAVLQKEILDAKMRKEG